MANQESRSDKKNKLLGQKKGNGKKIFKRK